MDIDIDPPSPSRQPERPQPEPKPLPPEVSRKMQDILRTQNPSQLVPNEYTGDDLDKLLEQLEGMGCAPCTAPPITVWLGSHSFELQKILEMRIGIYREVPAIAFFYLFPDSDEVSVVVVMLPPDVHPAPIAQALKAGLIGSLQNVRCVTKRAKYYHEMVDFKPEVLVETPALKTYREDLKKWARGIACKHVHELESTKNMLESERKTSAKERREAREQKAQAKKFEAWYEREAKLRIYLMLSTIGLTVAVIILATELFF